MNEQGFAWWSFDVDGQDDRTLLDLAWGAGMRGIDFLPEHLWSSAQEKGFTLLTIDGHPSIDRGLNDRTRSGELVDQVTRAVELAEAHRVRAVTIASGTDVGVSDDEAIDTLSAIVSTVLERSAGSDVRILLEPLNTKYDHPGHQCDTVEWARRAIDAVASPRLSLLLDVYHVQLMQGDVTNAIRSNADVLGHVHTAGVPGRAEIGPHQEINYPWLARVLREVGYDGWIVHEFVPTIPAARALREAYEQFADEN